MKSVDWKNIDWTERDITISKKHRVSRERVRQVRKRLNIPKSPNHKMDSQTIDAIAWLENRGNKYTRVRSKCDLGRESGFTVAIITSAIKHLGYQTKPKSRGLTLTRLQSLTTQQDGPLQTKCWIWHRPAKTYPTYNGQYVHRIGYKLVYGSIPQNTSLMHLCKNPACVNPAHMIPVYSLPGNRDSIRLTDAEIDIISAMYEDNSVNKIAMKLNRPYSTIYKHIRRQYGSATTR